MSFGDLLADLDASAFAELSDDNAALWTLQDGRIVTLSVILDRAQQHGFNDGLTLVTDVAVARISVLGMAQAIAATDDPPVAGIGEHARRPLAGETLHIRGRLHIFHGEPWLDDDMEGRDWLCPVVTSD